MPLRLLLILLTVPVCPAHAQVNLALNRPVAASSSEACCGNDKASYAVDARSETRWESNWRDEEWIYVDLGTHYAIERVVLRWENAYAKRYVIEVSDLAEHWQPIHTETQGEGDVDDLTNLSGTGRYIRMRGIERGTPFGYSLWEFEIYGRQPGAPRASFMVPLGPVFIHDAVAFDASATLDAEGDPMIHYWDFGDGTSGKGVTTVHAYAAPGTYTVTYTASDRAGFSDQLQRNLVVHDRAPTPAFNLSSIYLPPGDSVFFDAMPSIDHDGEIQAYTWDFGDGSTGVGRTTAHAYTAPGEYTITLAVTDNDGQTTRTAHDLEIAPKRPIRFRNGRPIPRTIVTTDGEIDDRSSFTRLLLYTNDFDLAGIVPTNSKWQKDGHGIGWILDLIDQYEKVYANLLAHDPHYPKPMALRNLIRVGNEDRHKMHQYGTENFSPGADLIVSVLLDDDPRPVWLQAWGGTNTIAQALWQLKNEFPEEEAKRALAKARIYAIANQDSTIFKLPELVPEAPLVLNYQFMAVNYQHAGHPYSDDEMFSPAWLNEHIKQNHGPLGTAYPQDYFSEGDSPAFFHLMNTGLRSDENLAYGGWGGRFQIKQGQFWVDAQDDGDTLKPLWRWLPALQNDVAARMDWTVTSTYAEANHTPVAALVHPDDLMVTSGDTVHVDARPTHDPDGNALTYQWWIYPEAGSYAGEVPVHLADSPQAYLIAPDVPRPQTLHLILTIKDDGTPSLTAYRRVIVTVQPKH